ncbi:hypothetical protein STANM309S_02549 [Streptomyces tanashiensis]
MPTPRTPSRRRRRSFPSGRGGRGTRRPRPALRPAAFARVWTRKEAYLKGIGTGLGADPSADYVGSGPVPTAPAGWLLADVVVPDGHHAAVALRR